MAYFYSQTIPVDGENLQLSREESRHLSKTLRGRLGDRIKLINGKGVVAEAEITVINRKLVECQILKQELLPEPGLKIHLFLAPPRNSILTSLIKQCVELGVHEITLIDCEYSVSKPKAKDSLFITEIITAAKQSGNPWFPTINPLIPFHKAIEFCDAPLFYGAVPEEKQNAAPDLQVSNAALWIGPEGGFSTHELSILKEKGTGLTIGSWVLRVETACTGLISLLNFGIANS